MRTSGYRDSDRVTAAGPCLPLLAESPTLSGAGRRGTRHKGTGVSLLIGSVGEINLYLVLDIFLAGRPAWKAVLSGSKREAARYDERPLLAVSMQQFCDYPTWKHISSDH